MNVIRVLVIDSTPAGAEWTRMLSLVQDIEPSSPVSPGDGEQALADAITASTPHVLLINVDSPGWDQAAQQVREQLPAAGLLLLSPAAEPDVSVYRTALQLGAHDVATGEMDSLRLADLVYRAFDRQEQRPTSPPEQSGSRDTSGTVINVFSTKGGVGKTTVAVNLATALARMRAGRIALWDLDLQFGNMALFLDVQAPRPFSDLMAEIHDLDPELLETYMASHSTGVKVLAAPYSPEYAEFVSREHVEQILRLLRQSFDYVIVDSAAHFNDNTIAALDRSDQVLLVTVPDLATVYSVKACRTVLEQMEVPAAKLKLIINKASRTYGVRIADVEATLNMTAFSQIPNDERLAMQAVNSGAPFVISNPQAAISQRIIDLARQISTSPRAGRKPARQGLLRLLPARREA